VTVQPGRTNSLTDVAGITVGHYGRTDAGWLSGTTVVRALGEGAVGGVDVRGGAPGTRETDLLTPGTLVDRVHAVVLSGGSAYGLAAACGVTDALGEQGSAWLWGRRASSCRSCPPPSSSTWVAGATLGSGRTRPSDGPRWPP